jgi:hypothetical protein
MVVLWGNRFLLVPSELSCWMSSGRAVEANHRGAPGITILEQIGTGLAEH